MWQISPAGDQALLVTLSSTVDPAVLGEVLSLDRALKDRRPQGLIGTVTAYGSLLCHYNPAVTRADRLQEVIRELEGRPSTSFPLAPIVDVPTLYDGPDLADVAMATNHAPAEVIELHADREYLVYCVGFAPGFTYCGELPAELAVPRKAAPRRSVAAGSVAIAGRQTGIYAVESPGGWNLIGRTDLTLFDPIADPPARFKPGDRLRFVPVA